ncbi:MAG: glycoside hydrolase family 2 protein, partial [Bacteroidales bacterium]|nr:glycoside hydrolase family 2 protein [Bacteroidales bacterium]
IYDVRPEITDRRDDRDADTRPTEAVKIEAFREVLKPWILPTANVFIKNDSDRHIRPPGNPGNDFPFVQNDFDDSGWEKINLPHDWGALGPFQEGQRAEVGGGMGRLPSHGIAWYRKKIFIPESDSDKSVYLDIDGAMSYAMIWLNGNLAGGWPYGYNSFRLNLTPYIIPGKDNQLAIRIDNPPNSARWYPGGGIYRNIWLVKTDQVHVGHWGTFITTRNVSVSSATVDMEITIDNNSRVSQAVEVVTMIFDFNGEQNPDAKASFPVLNTEIPAGKSVTIKSSVVIKNPLLWGPPPSQKPNLYQAVSTLYIDGKPVDNHTTRFGIRSINFDPQKGIIVNGEHIPVKGVNQHHDLGALGTAFNIRAAERQLEILQEMGCNAIRTAHNPPAPELLELTDRMGFLVMDEIFDVWESRKTPLDFHLIFPDWYEPDLRAFIRRDRNCPSVVMWSFGNEVGEQYTDEQGAAIGKRLYNIVREEDPTRPATASMNYAKPDMPFPHIMDVISLNYQGEGIRDAPAYLHLRGIKTEPLYGAFHDQFPDKVILSSESASTLSTRGTYIFPVTSETSAPAENNSGGDPEKRFVSAYELYTAPFGSAPDKVFASQDKNPFVAGEFVWTGWDYLGEPTPYYLSRSSYSGIIDLAGFKKDRFYLYQSHWRPDMPMAHILPHWNWPDRIGETVPVHIFTSGDEAELFLNDRSLGRKKKKQYEYRLRWDSVKYEPGEIRVITYKKGKPWAKSNIKTTGTAEKLILEADRQKIQADGKDLSFIQVMITDKNGLIVPVADNLVKFSIKGPGEILATDNGDPTSFIPFQSKERKAFNGLALVIVRTKAGMPGKIKITAESEGLKPAGMTINSR